MLHGLPPDLHLNVAIPVLTVLVASTSFFTDLDILGTVGFGAAGLAAAYLPACFVSLVDQGWGGTTLALFYYSVPLTTFGGVWLVGRLEGTLRKPSGNSEPLLAN
jgi:hypothetical protein